MEGPVQISGLSGPALSHHGALRPSPFPLFWEDGLEVALVGLNSRERRPVARIRPMPLKPASTEGLLTARAEVLSPRPPADVLSQHGRVPTLGPR